MTELQVDYDEIIHSDARNGYIASLEVYLKHKPECINKIYQFGDSKWTLLLAACYYQHEDIVQMLVTQFNADVEEEGVVSMKDSNNSYCISEGVSPLWVAAAVNNFRIVKFLVQYGLTNVNHLTKEHSTPLREACRNGNLDMVQFLIQYGANPHQAKLNNRTNLMLVVFHQYMDLAIYFVDTLKCDLNQKDEDGETALSIAVKNDFLEITKFLLSRGALNLCNQSKNITPLTWAAVRGKSDFVAAFDNHCSDVEWIEARELLGSAYLGCRPVMEDINSAVEYLTLAFEARATKNLPKLLPDRTIEAFNDRRECETLEDLNQLVSFGSREAFYIEGLLIQERLLSTNSKIYHDSLRHIGETMAIRNQYDVCLRLWFYELDLRRQHGIFFNEQDLRWFPSLFENMILAGKTQAYINDLCKVLTIMKDELSSVQNSENNNYNLVTLLHLLTISAYLLLDEDTWKVHKLSINDCQLLVKQIKLIIQQKYITIGSGSSLLHLACHENTESLGSIAR
jgi:hypothetical protein